MRIVDPAKDRETDEFASRAAEDFKKNPKLQIFTDEPELQAEQLVALRWNPFTVLVLRTAECEEILLFDKATKAEGEEDLMSSLENFRPIPEHINALPAALRQYICDLELSVGRQALGQIKDVVFWFTEKPDGTLITKIEPEEIAKILMEKRNQGFDATRSALKLKIILTDDS